MENQIKVFENAEFGNVRTVVENDVVLFCGSDVAKCLGYSRPNDAVAAHCRSTAKYSIPHPQSKDKSIEMAFIMEGDVYRLITHSKLPSAEKFERWVFDDVLPAIRKHGMYATPQTVEQMLADPDTMIQTLIALKEERAKRQALEAQAEVNQPKVLFADTISKSKDNILIGDMAKLLCDKAFKIGQKRLFKLLRDRKVLQENNVPYQRFIDAGYFEVKENSFEIREQVVLNYTTLVTPRGQMWITNSIKDWVDESEG